MTQDLALIEMFKSWGKRPQPSKRVLKINSATVRWIIDTCVDEAIKTLKQPKFSDKRALRSIPKIATL